MTISMIEGTRKAGCGKDTRGTRRWRSTMLMRVVYLCGMVGMLRS